MLKDYGSKFAGSEKGMVIKMRKYLFIYKTTVMESLQYIANQLLGLISYIIIIFVFLNLWQYIYADSSQRIQGYTMGQMVWYVILTEIMWFGNSNRTLTRQISDDIKSGAIAYGLNKPYNYLYFMIAKHFGEITLKLFIYLVAGIAMGYSFVGAIPEFNTLHLPYIAIVFVLGLIINSLLRILISVLSFWIEDAMPFHWLYNKMLLVIGTLFPVEMFPLWFQPIIKCTPIFVVTYGPAKLIIDFSMDMFFRVLLAQGIYMICSIAILTIFFQKGVKKLNVNGG